MGIDIVRKQEIVAKTSVSTGNMSILFKQFCSLFRLMLEPQILVIILKWSQQVKTVLAYAVFFRTLYQQVERYSCSIFY